MNISLRLCSFLVLFLLLGGRQTEAFVAQGQQSADKGSAVNPFTLVFDKETLRAEIKNVPLTDVLKALARQTTLSIEVGGSIADEKISALFDSLPLEEGLHTLLRHQNYILLYSAFVAESNAAYVVDGIKIAGKGNGPSFFLGDRYSHQKSQPVSPWSAFQKGNEQQVTERRPDPERYSSFRSPLPPSLERENRVQSHQEQANVTGPSPDDVPNAPLSNKSRDERIEDMENLAYEKGLAAIPYLERVARSDPNASVRSYAQELINDVRDDAEDTDEED